MIDDRQQVTFVKLDFLGASASGLEESNRYVKRASLFPGDPYIYIHIIRYETVPEPFSPGSRHQECQVYSSSSFI